METFKMKVFLFDRGGHIVANGESLITSNFSICHSVFKRRLLQKHQKAFICGKGFKVISKFSIADLLYSSMWERSQLPWKNVV